jgi:hypothetical protein
MKIRWFIYGSVVLGSALFTAAIAACAPDTSAPTLQASARTSSEAQETAVVVSLATPTPMLEPFTDYACLNCHTDQAQLTLLAVEDKVTEALSEGPG